MRRAIYKFLPLIVVALAGLLGSSSRTFGYPVDALFAGGCMLAGFLIARLAIRRSA